MSKFSRFLAGLAIGAALVGGAVQAHALLLSFKVDGQDVVLHYNGRVDAGRSRLSLLNADGSNAQKLDCEAGEDQATLKSHLGSVAPGSYILRWEVLSVDGHISRGDQAVTLPAQ